MSLYKKIFQIAPNIYSSYLGAEDIQVAAADMVTRTAHLEPTGSGDMAQLKRGARISTAELSGNRKDGTSKYVSIVKKRITHNRSAHC